MGLEDQLPKGQFDIQGDIAFLHAAGVLKWLLEDRTTRKHILWGTDAYRERGPEYARDQEMEIGQITGENNGLLKTRAQKAAEQQTERTRQHAEVFTPAWICRKMNDQADQEWFGRENVFFREDRTPTERIDFKRKSWRKYTAQHMFQNVDSYVSRVPIRQFFFRILKKFFRLKKNSFLKWQVCLCPYESRLPLLCTTALKGGLTEKRAHDIITIVIELRGGWYAKETNDDKGSDD